MAFRIDKSIVRGEITNEVPGIVTGRIWLLGREKPIVLQLEGNCLSDLAGSSLTFENPSPSPQEIDGLVTYQVGRAGDMTASQKVRVPTVSDEELTTLIQRRQHIPARWSNYLYLEWYSDTNGRIVIQTEEFNTVLSEPRWILPKKRDLPGRRPGTASPPNGGRLHGESEDDSPGRFPATGEEFLVESDNPTDDDFDADAPLDEFEWEQELRDAEERADAYQEALEKFHEHIDPKEILDHLADHTTPAETPTTDPRQPATSDQGTSSQEGEDVPHKHHELTGRAMEIAVSIRKESEHHNLHHLSSNGASNGSPAMRAMASTVQFGGRLAAALDGIANGADPERGFIVAMLKRSLVPLNTALEDCTAAIGAHASIPALAACLTGARTKLFNLRHDILDLMAELRSNS
ncbi:MAG: hypothetical protein P8J87_20065 [Verrucomicrobiales bacterium]|nr:hypothetical protein [Verrucomicrobiales bacterium]